MTNPHPAPGQVPLSTWRLGADPDALDAAASAWELLGAGLRERVETLSGGADTLLASVWRGATRDSYEQYRNRFLKSLEEAAVEAESFAGALGALAALTRSVQASLDLNYQGVTGRYQHLVSGDQVTFQEADLAAVSAWVARATANRQEYLEACATLRNAIGTDTWEAHLTRWQDVARGEADPFEPPEDLDQTGVIYVDGTVVVGTGSGDDTVQVATAEDGSIIVAVNGKEHWYAPATPIAILTGAGQDVIEVTPGVPVRLTLGGTGADVIDSAGIRVVAQVEDPADLSSIQIEGSDEFVNTVEAGLAAVRSELERVGSGGTVDWPGEHTIIIRESGIGVGSDAVQQPHR